MLLLLSFSNKNQVYTRLIKDFWNLFFNKRKIYNKIVKKTPLKEVIAYAIINGRYSANRRGLGDMHQFYSDVDCSMLYIGFCLQDYVDHKGKPEESPAYFHLNKKQCKVELIKCFIKKKFQAFY